MSQYHSGDLLNRMDNDVASVSSSVLGWLPDLVTRLVQFLGALGIILYYDPTLAGLALPQRAGDPGGVPHPHGPDAPIQPAGPGRSALR